MEKFSFEKASKFSAKDRFFDINYVWTPGLSWVVEKLYYTSIRPEAIILLSVLAGIMSGWCYAKGGYLNSLCGILFFQIKNYLDTVDGHVARSKGLESRSGRFLDSIGDAVANLCLFTGIAIHLGKGSPDYGDYLLSYTAMITSFLLCSIYCYYLVSYKTRITGEGLNRTDEGISEQEKAAYKNSLSGKFLLVLHYLYLAIYGWQDKFVEALDKTAFNKALRENPHTPEETLAESWYANKKFLSRIAPLCFGTQIMFLTLFTVLGGLEEFLWFLILAGSGYALSLIFGRGRIEVGP